MGTYGGEELVGVAYAGDRGEAEMIQGLLRTAGIRSATMQVGIDGPLVGVGLLNPGGGARRVMVRAEQAEAARAVLAGAVAEREFDDRSEFPELVHPEDARRKPRDYGVVGAYARAWLWSLALMALAFGVFLLLRQV